MYDYLQGYHFNYSYDNAGNIWSDNVQYLNSDGEPSGDPYGKVYYYDNENWCDLLTAVNTDTITYDEIGNPTEYLNSMEMEWQHGRQLKAITSKDLTIEYKYDANGMRTYKKSGDNTTYYYYDSSNNLIAQDVNGTVSYFYYDSNGEVTSMSVGDMMYFFIKNLQGDIIKAIDKDGNVHATYAYDAWGNILEETEAPTFQNLNPFRYRGYVYDKDTKFYYLQSRYYDPNIGRFLNADDTAYLGATGTALSCNLFAYCENNAVNNVDPTGNVINAVFGAITGAIFASLTYFIEYWLGIRVLNWWAFAGVVAVAATLGAIGGYINGWIKFAKLCKYARLPKYLVKLKSPIIRDVVKWASVGLKFIINSFVKKLTKKPNENWISAVRRWLKV